MDDPTWVVYAHALQTATSGQYFYNTWTRTTQLNKAGKDQEASLGFEIDLGVPSSGMSISPSWWTMAFTCRAGLCIFECGRRDNATSPVFATSVRIGVSF